MRPTNFKKLGQIRCSFSVLIREQVKGSTYIFSLLPKEAKNSSNSGGYRIHLDVLSARCRQIIIHPWDSKRLALEESRQILPNCLRRTVVSRYRLFINCHLWRDENVAKAFEMVQHNRQKFRVPWNNIIKQMNSRPKAELPRLTRHSKTCLI